MAFILSVSVEAPFINLEKFFFSQLSTYKRASEKYYLYIY